MSRLTALILAGALQITSCGAALAAPNDLPIEPGINVAFKLPINGQLESASNVSDAPPAKMELWAPPPGQSAAPAAPNNVALGAPDSVPPLTGVVEQTEVQDGVIVIDNDLVSEIELQEDYKWAELPDEQGRTQISAGARFPVEVTSAHTSKTAKVGDPVQARLKVDLKIGGKLVAPKGSVVSGHIATAAKARRILHAELALNKRWMRANGSVGIQFDEVITPEGEHLPLVAAPARKARIIKNKNEGRVLGINHSGEVATPLSIQLKHQALHLAIRGACSAGGVFSFGAVPLAYGVVGAMNPSFAFLHPVGKNVPHRRLKGFAMGVVSGLPGGFLIADSIIKGSEAIIKPGDEFLAEFKQDFTGEAATDAQLLPGASTKVRGQILDEKSDKKK